MPLFSNILSETQHAQAPDDVHWGSTPLCTQPKIKLCEILVGLALCSVLHVDGTGDREEPAGYDDEVFKAL
jgi:hypothetical protein